MPNSVLIDLLAEQKRILLDAYLKVWNNKVCLDREHEEEYVFNERERDNYYQRDFARILYSSSFRRLQGKMQILGIEHASFFRNRLTHSLEVMQIAKGIAGLVRKALSEFEDVYGCDMYVIEAASIAHDIGHPAFGHSGERVLNELSGGIGFEGNAQNFRVLRHIERKFPTFRGLNLTYRTLFSILKYKIPLAVGNKKFLYPDDLDFFQNTITNHQFVHRTLDVQIIDIADEIAYATHDLEDALSMGYFDIEELVFEFSKLPQCERCTELLDKVVSQAQTIAKKSSVTFSASEYSHIFKKELTSCLINELINDITLVPVSPELQEKTGSTNQEELGFDVYSGLVKGLKELTFKCVNQKNSILVYEKKGEIIIRGLFHLFMDENINKNFILLPSEYRPTEGAGNEIVIRCVLDYIAGMMDSYAISQYEQYFGRKFCDITFECPDNSQPAQPVRVNTHYT